MVRTDSKFALRPGASFSVGTAIADYDGCPGRSREKLTGVVTFDVPTRL